MEQPVPDGHLGIQDLSQPHGQCPYLHPYSLDQLHLTPEYASTSQYMDLSDIFDLPDVMATTNNKDIPSLEDVFGC